MGGWGVDESWLVRPPRHAGFPLASIVSYGSQVCGWENWDRGGLSGLYRGEKLAFCHYCIEFPNAGNLTFLQMETQQNAYGNMPFP